MICAESIKVKNSMVFQTNFFEKSILIEIWYVKKNTDILNFINY